MPDVSRAHGRTYLQRHRLTPLRQLRENGRTATAWRQFNENHQRLRLRGSVCRLLASVQPDRSYWIIGGWAIDLAVGRVTRDHADVDVMMLERDKHALWSDLTGVDVEPAGALGPGRLVLHSDRLRLPTEVFLSRATGTSLVYRRGAHSVTRALAGITCYRDSIPYLAPEVVLLFKARSKAARDQHDVETALPLLDAGQRSWLHDTLKLLPHGNRQLCLTNEQLAAGAREGIPQMPHPRRRDLQRTLPHPTHVRDARQELDDLTSDLRKELRLTRAPSTQVTMKLAVPTGIFGVDIPVNVRAGIPGWLDWVLHRRPHLKFLRDPTLSGIEFAPFELTYRALPA